MDDAKALLNQGLQDAQSFGIERLIHDIRSNWSIPWLLLSRAFDETGMHVGFTAAQSQKYFD